MSFTKKMLALVFVIQIIGMSALGTSGIMNYLVFVPIGMMALFSLCGRNSVEKYLLYIFGATLSAFF